MKRKIFAVLATALAVVFLGAAPNIKTVSHSMHKETNAASAIYVGCNIMNGSYAGSHGMMDGRVAGRLRKGMMIGSHGLAYGMMSTMTGMMGMVRGKMNRGADYSGMICPYGRYDTQPQNQKEEVK